MLYAIQDSVSYRYLSDALNQRINHTDGDIQVMFRYIRAYVRSLNKDYAGANSDLSRLIQNEQDYDHSALEMRAYNYMQTEQYQSALTDYSRLITLSPRNTRAYYGRSLAHRGLFEIDEAISDLLSLTRLDYNEAPNAFYQAARLEVEREHYTQAYPLSIPRHRTRARERLPLPLPCRAV